MSPERNQRRAHDVMIYLPSISGAIDPDSSRGGGGAETQMLLLAQGLARLGARVCMAAFDDAGELPRSVHGVDIVPRSGYHARRGLPGKLREAAAIYACIARGDADVVLARVATPAIAFVAWSCRLQRRRFVYSSANVTDFEHEQVEPSHRKRALVGHGIALAERIVVQTEEQRRLCERRFSRDATLIRSIAQPAAQRERDPEAFLWAGRISPTKQPLAFVELARAVPEARFWMVCVPEPAEESHKLLDEVRASAQDVPNLELLAPLPRSELGTLIARSVAVVNTADFEGLSNVLLEAWARGVPAVALSHDPDGLIECRGLGGFAEGSPVRLAALVRALWRDRRQQTDLAERCRRYVQENHLPEAVFAQWSQALRLAPAAQTEQPVLVGAS
jgi:glycosyltransferase involved in cell wall biosynthesis